MPSPRADADAAADEELRGLARLATDAELVSAVLARLDERDPRYARRFEVYAHGRAGCLELCNAFDELTDAREQRARFDDDNATRARLGKPVLPLDEDFLAALPRMPRPSAGNALGFDRLWMLLTGAERIDEVRALPWR